MFSSSVLSPPRSFFFFFNDTATTEIYTLSLHDALPIFGRHPVRPRGGRRGPRQCEPRAGHAVDRKSTRLNSSHLVISYAVFCLKKKKDNQDEHDTDRCSDIVTEYDSRRDNKVLTDSLRS